MNLVIVESPAKAKTIEKYLGKNYHVLASKGHVVDLPKSDLGIDLDHNFKPTYIIKNEVALDAIKKAAKGVDTLILAVDPDREGEAIGWHIARQLKLIKDNGEMVSKAKHKLVRIVFTEITKEAITSAVENPRSIDMNLVNAQQTRRILDRIVGYKLSPLLWKKLMFGLSAGRVQSVALKLIVDRELEREAFKPEEYWNLFSLLDKKSFDGKVKLIINKQDVEAPEILPLPVSDTAFKFTLIKFKDKKIKLVNEADTHKVIKAVQAGEWIIKDIETKKVTRSPNPPFNTSTMQQAAANQLGMNANRTMKIAQQLYEMGHITYMRTDSFNLSTEAINKIREYILKTFGKEYIPTTPRFYKTKSKVAQEAHEAIRPTHNNSLAKDLKATPEQQRLYDLIWKRTMACQMSDALMETANILVNVVDYGFQLQGQKVLFSGFYAVHADKVKEVELPNLSVDQKLFLRILQSDQHFTDPPARYTEATLIKALEANGIGRPSTYAPIISTIQARKYVEKDGRFLLPTLVGRALNTLMVDHFPKIVDVKFTAQMEDDLDEVANGSKDWIKTLSEFWKDFEKTLIKGEKTIDKNKYLILGKSKEKCPECGKKMLIKLGRFSPFLSCADFPKCKGMKSLETDQGPKVDIESEDFKSKYKDPPKTDDGRIYLLKRSKYGYFWAHPDYPKVKDAKTLELTDDLLVKVYGKSPKADDGKKMVLRRSRFGFFWTHPDYPKVKQIVKINNKDIQEKRTEFGLL